MLKFTLAYKFSILKFGLENLLKIYFRIIACILKRKDLNCTPNTNNCNTNVKGITGIRR